MQSLRSKEPEILLEFVGVTEEVLSALPLLLVYQRLRVWPLYGPA